MKDFNKRGGFGGGAGGGRGGFGGGRPSSSFKVGGDRGASFGPSRGPSSGGYTKSYNKFGNDRGGDRGGRGGFGGPTEMHQAVCARCGKTCEVPFRPNGRKPVFCKECFVQQDGGAPAHMNAHSSAPTQSYSQPAPRRDYSQAPAASSTPDYKAQFEQMNAKIDTLTRMVKALGYAQANAAVPAAEQVVVATLKVGEGDEAKADSTPEKPKAKKAKKA